MLPDTGLCGLTRLQYESMRQRIPLTVISQMTTIPVATLSRYQTGRNSIPLQYLYVIATALNVHPAKQLLAPTPANMVFVDEDELSEANPLPLRHHRRTAAAE